MKNMILKLTTFTILVAAIAGMTAIARAADTDAAAPAAKSKSTGDKFYGPITAVDTNAMTFTVNDQVYSVNSKTEVTLAKDGSKATLADAMVGEPARGSYTKSSDGKMEVTKVRFGKKTSSNGAGGKSGGKKSKKSGETTGSTNTPPQQ